MNTEKSPLDIKYINYMENRENIAFHELKEDSFSKSDNFAIAIPYRERKEHLNRFLKNRSIKNFNKKIYLFEQVTGKRFNKGALLNVACRELGSDYQRLIFHDIDLLPNEKLFEYYYYADSGVVHLVRPDSAFKYNFPHYFGGVLSFNVKDYQMINGSPNDFFGWGAEDDVLYNRVANSELKVFRPATGDYFVIDHVTAGRRERNPFMREMEMDYYYNSIQHGLNEVEYNIIRIEENSKYVKYVIEL